MPPSLLIVEHDLGQLDFLTAHFIRAGYRVVGVDHPRRALEATGFRQFQVALIDAGLPEIDGLELMQRMKRTQDDMQVVILSGYEYPEWRAKLDGAFACLVKPCRLKRLEAAVAEACERAAEASLV